MLFKILFVTLFVSTCSGAPPVHPQTESNQAVYSQSFVREDVPMSYQYSAVHYYSPKEHEASKDVNPIRNFNNPALKPMSNKTIQFAPVAANPREYTYPTAPVLYTSIISDPASQYGEYELTENSAKSVLSKYNLEPKAMPVNAKNVNPSTYKPHMNHDIKIFHASRLRPNKYLHLNIPTTTIETTPEVRMGGKLRHEDLFRQLEQHLIQQTEYIPSSTTEPLIFNHVRNLGVSVLPKYGTNNFTKDTKNTEITFHRHGTPLTIPHEIYGITPFQPISRIAYHNKVQVAPEKPGRPRTHTNHRIHLNRAAGH